MYKQQNFNKNSTRMLFNYYTIHVASAPLSHCSIENETKASFTTWTRVSVSVRALEATSPGYIVS